MGPISAGCGDRGGPEARLGSARRPQRSARPSARGSLSSPPDGRPQAETVPLAHQQAPLSAQDHRSGAEPVPALPRAAPAPSRLPELRHLRGARSGRAKAGYRHRRVAGGRGRRQRRRPGPGRRRRRRPPLRAARAVVRAGFGALGRRPAGGGSRRPRGDQVRRRVGGGRRARAPRRVDRAGRPRRGRRPRRRPAERRLDRSHAGGGNARHQADPTACSGRPSRCCCRCRMGTCCSSTPARASRCARSTSCSSPTWAPAS